MFAAERIEPHDAAKKNCHVVISFSRYRPFVPQLIGYRGRQNWIQQPETKRHSLFSCAFLNQKYSLYLVSQKKMGSFWVIWSLLPMCGQSKQSSCLLQFVKRVVQQDIIDFISFRMNYFDKFPQTDPGISQYYPWRLSANYPQSCLCTRSLHLDIYPSGGFIGLFVMQHDEKQI